MPTKQSRFDVQKPTKKGSKPKNKLIPLPRDLCRWKPEKAFDQELLRKRRAMTNPSDAEDMDSFLRGRKKRFLDAKKSE